MLLIATCLLLHGIISPAQESAQAPAWEPGLDQGLILPYEPPQAWNPAVLPPPADDYTIFYSPPERIDALFAAFMDAIPYVSVEDYAAKNPGATYMEFMTKMMPPLDLGALKALQPRFGDMPEYWQMMFLFGEGSRSERSIYLAKAYRLFPYDPATVYFYGRYAVMPSGDDTDKPEIDGITHYRLEREVAQLVVRAAELDAHNSFYLFEAALLVSSCGGIEDVLDNLRRGNECPVSEWVDPFPLSYIQRHREDLPMAYPQKYLFLARFRFPEAFRARIDYKIMFRDLASCVSMSGELGWLTDAHRMSCRYATQRYGEMMTALMGGVFEGILSREAVDLGYAPETPEEVSGFAMFENKRGQVSGQLQAVSFANSDELNRLTGANWEELYTMKVSDPRFKEYLRLGWEHDSNYARLYAPHVWKQYERLIAFDFADPGAYTGLPLAVKAVEPAPPGESE